MTLRKGLWPGVADVHFVVDTVSTLEALRNLRDEWDTVYELDPVAGINRSWSWITSWIEGTRVEWLVLIVRESVLGRAVGFLPLALERRRGLGVVVDLAGNPMSEHTGAVVLPDCEEAVLDTLSDYIGGMKEWSELRARECLDSRVERLLLRLASRGWSLWHQPGTPCPYINLPESWETYLAGLSQKSRENTRRALRQTEACEGFRVLESTVDNLNSQVDIAFRLREARFGQVPDELKRHLRTLLFSLLSRRHS